MTMLLLPLTFTSLSPSPLIIDNCNCQLFSPGDSFSIFNNLVTLAEIFHLQKLFLKGQCIDPNVSAALLCGYQSKGKPYTRAPQTKIHAFKWKKNYTLATVAETGARQRDTLEKIRINVHTIKASEEDSKDRILEEQERQLISKDKGVIVWPLLCQIQNLEVSKKCSSIFKYLIYLSKLICAFYTKLSKSTKGEENNQEIFLHEVSAYLKFMFLKYFCSNHFPKYSSTFWVFVLWHSTEQQNRKLSQEDKHNREIQFPSNPMVFL